MQQDQPAGDGSVPAWVRAGRGVGATAAGTGCRFGYRAHALLPTGFGMS